MTTDTKTLTQKARQQGYEGDPMVDEILAAAASWENECSTLRGQINTLKSQPYASPWIISVLGVIAIVSLVVAAYLGWELNLSSQQLATANANLAAKTKLWTETSASLKTVSEQMASALQTANTTTQQAARAAADAASSQTEANKLMRQILDAQAKAAADPTRDSKKADQP